MGDGEIGLVRTTPAVIPLWEPKSASGVSHDRSPWWKKKEEGEAEGNQASQLESSESRVSCRWRDTRRWPTGAMAPSATGLRRHIPGASSSSQIGARIARKAWPGAAPARPGMAPAGSFRAPPQPSWRRIMRRRRPNGRVGSVEPGRPGLRPLRAVVMGRPTRPAWRCWSTSPSLPCSPWPMLSSSSRSSRSGPRPSASGPPASSTRAIPWPPRFGPMADARCPRGRLLAWSAGASQAAQPRSPGALSSPWRRRLRPCGPTSALASCDSARALFVCSGGFRLRLSATAATASARPMLPAQILPTQPPNLGLTMRHCANKGRPLAAAAVPSSAASRGRCARNAAPAATATGPVRSGTGIERGRVIGRSVGCYANSGVDQRSRVQLIPSLERRD